MNILIGHTGLIGETLQEKINFDFVYNTNNINNFDKEVSDGNNLWLSCLPATKWLVNKNLQKDIQNINFLINILNKKKYNNIFLFSTIDVYNNSPLLVNEDYYPNIKELSYGTNRYFFELFVDKFLEYNNLKIFRLPAVFGKKIKKNILYDLINGNQINKIKINSLYQWYNLENLYKDVLFYDTNYRDDKIFNFFNEPIPTIEILNFFPDYINQVEKNDIPITYNCTTKFKKNGYFNSKEETLKEIKKFIDEFSIK
jgi:hypothetical protein